MKLIKLPEPDLPNSVLGLYAEEEGGGEVLDVLHTDLVVLRLEGAEVTMEESDEIPNTGKHQPGGKVGTCSTILLSTSSLHHLQLLSSHPTLPAFLGFLTKEIEDNPGPGESDGG